MARLMKRSALIGSIAILLSAVPALAAEASYACSGGTRLVAKFSPPAAAKGKVALTFDNGRDLTLPQVLSADGGRYANASVEFWIKGRSATLTVNGVQQTCMTR